jgi:hypothetical protein
LISKQVQTVSGIETVAFFPVLVLVRFSIQGFHFGQWEGGMVEEERSSGFWGRDKGIEARMGRVKTEDDHHGLNRSDCFGKRAFTVG